MAKLATRQCEPCRGGTPPLRGGEITELLDELGEGWEVIDEHHLQRSYKFEDFGAAQEFVIRVGKISEEQGHHPDICFGWGYVDIKLWTHKIDGLSVSDFILAAKIDQ